MKSQHLNAVVRRVSLADSIYETLVEAIVSGTLPSGSELNSVGLAKQLDVSRTPLREALKLLERDGLVQQVGNHKARVAEFSPDDVREMYEVRLLLEGAAAEEAAKRIALERLDDIRAEAVSLCEHTDEVGWGEKVVDFDQRFHEAIAGAAGNRRLASEIRRYRLLVRSFCVMSGEHSVLQQAMAEHLVILDALAARRPATARKAMVKHVEQRLHAVLERFSNRDSTDSES